MSISLKYKNVILRIILIVVLVIFFIITTYALIKNKIFIDDNLFKTGIIKINLNGGQAIIGEEGFLIEPGMMIQKDFFIENQSSFDVYYKLYFDDISGDLADVLDVTIKKDNLVLYRGTINELTKKNVKSIDKPLKINEVEMLKISFYYPEDFGNDTQNSDIYFRLSADAVQAKNNINREFD